MVMLFLGLCLTSRSWCPRPSLTRPFGNQTVYEPTVFENYVHDIFVDNIHMELSLWDTAGQEEFDRLRSLSYDDTQAIMLCFSVDNLGSLENVSTKWIAEINEHCPGVKIVLCALKCDLREEHEKEDDEDAAAPARPMIQYNQGLEVARRIGALRYLGTMLSNSSPCLWTTNTANRMLSDAQSRR
jgi:small GTP-binding protein